MTMNIRQLLCIVFAGSMSAATPVGSPSPTFTKNVAPILQANCQSCHRPG